MIARDTCMEIVQQHLPGDAIVLAGLGTTARAWRARAAPQPTYFISDPMAIGTSMALGLALAQPQRDVVFMGGDGDFIMSLGTLLTIAEVRPSNLKLIIFFNARYETGGGQPLAAAEMLSLSTIARGAGWTRVHETADADEAPRLVEDLLSRSGMGLLVLHTQAAPAPYPAAGPWSQSEHRAFFMRQLHGESGIDR